MCEKGSFFKSLFAAVWLMGKPALSGHGGGDIQPPWCPHSQTETCAWFSLLSWNALPSPGLCQPGVSPFCLLLALPGPSWEHPRPGWMELCPCPWQGCHGMLLQVLSCVILEPGAPVVPRAQPPPVPQGLRAGCGVKPGTGGFQILAQNSPRPQQLRVKRGSEGAGNQQSPGGMWGRQRRVLEAPRGACLCCTAFPCTGEHGKHQPGTSEGFRLRIS